MAEYKDAAPKTNPVEDILYATARAQEVPGAKTVALTDAEPLKQMLSMKEETGSEAYEWHITQLPADQVVPAMRVKDLAVSLHADVSASRARPDREDWTDAQHREEVLRSNNAYEAFSRTHPRLVIMLTGSECTPQKLMHLMRLIELRRHQEGSAQTNDERKEQAANYFKYHFVRPAKPGEEEEAVRTGRGLRGTAVTRDEMLKEQASSLR